MQETFDVFLCHNSRDKSAVRELADLLERRGLSPWLDERQLIPGRPWQPELENAILRASTIAVLIGKDGQGPWQNAEMRAALALGVEKGKPVIPVLLPGAAEKPELPLFLSAMTWVDLRKGFEAAGLDRLEWGIRGTTAGTRPPAAASPPAPDPAPVPPAAVAPSPAPPAKPEAPRSFWQRNKEKLERWTFVLGGIALVLGIASSVLDLPGKWADFREKVSAAPPAAPEKQLLKGRITDADTALPLQGVDIWLPEPKLRAKTDADGQFELHLDVAESTRVKMLATLEGFAPLDEDPPVGAFLHQWQMRRLE